MKSIRWSRRSRTDLRDIRTYIARDSQHYAQRMVSRIRRAVQHVRLFPEAGSLVAEWGSAEFREIYVGNYRVIYEVQLKTVDIVTIIHAARQLPDLPDA